MIRAFATVLNEADIIATTLAHLYNHGVDEIYIALGPTTDGTREEMAPFPVHIYDDVEPYHFQPWWINRMIDENTKPGDWVIPFDADEFWYGAEYYTIAETLDRIGSDQVCLHVNSHQHRDWQHRFVDNLGLGKTAFVYQEGAAVANGNHSVWLPQPATMHWDVLALRELQFRSYEHMVVKCRERTDRIDPSLPFGEGAHQRQLAALTEVELRAAWDERMARPVANDPIPVRR